MTKLGAIHEVVVVYGMYLLHFRRGVEALRYGVDYARQVVQTGETGTRNRIQIRIGNCGNEFVSVNTY